jgi:UDPglucose 6-dehydrogenase
MKISVVGLGKLGLPVAIGIERKGHQVFAYDIRPEINSQSKIIDCLNTEEKNEKLDGDIKPYLEESKIIICDSLEECLQNGEIVFIAIQTPHHPNFGGDKPIPNSERSDFDYNFLIKSIQDISSILDHSNNIDSKIVSIISTVLPTTLRKHILPIMSPKIKLCYNPFFIAMGTVLYDFYNPEFVLLGRVDEEAENKVKEFYSTITEAPIFSTTLENAELIKVSYNTFITTKIVMMNNLMEMCHYLPNTDIDDVSNALEMANRRLISKMYMRGGMGDGGGCHPRDNIAMSWLNRELGIENNYYDFIIKKREDQSMFLAKLVVRKHLKFNLPICILGKAFKPETNLLDGSPALLLKHQLEEMGYAVENYDPLVDINVKVEDVLNSPKVFIIGTKHHVFREYNFPEKSFVIDPHRYLDSKKLEKNNIKYFGVGVGRE